jgi:hypothetical protein
MRRVPRERVRQGLHYPQLTYFRTLLRQTPKTNVSEFSAAVHNIHLAKNEVFDMTKKKYLLIGAIVVLIAAFTATYHSIAQTKTPSSNVTGMHLLRQECLSTATPAIRTIWNIALCKTTAAKKRPLFFDAYVDKPVNDAQIDLKLYAFEG